MVVASLRNLSSGVESAEQRLACAGNGWILSRSTGISDWRLAFTDSRGVSMPTRSASFKPPSLISKTNRESAIGNRGCGSYDEADETV
jgi:hypothetical protein